MLIKSICRYAQTMKVVKKKKDLGNTDLEFLKNCQVLGFPSFSKDFFFLGVIPFWFIDFLPSL